MTEPTPLNVIDLMRVVMSADEETRGFALRGTTNWAAHIGKAVQNAVIAKLWTPEQIAEAKERAKKFEPWLLANQEPLGAEFEAVLDKHRSDLYAEATPQPTQAQAGAGEPIGYLYCGGSYGDELADWEIVADQHQCDKLNEHHGALGKEAKLPLYTAPQPAQAQAGAVPLTREQVKAICVESGYETATLQERADFINGIRHAERHHGIKGGQHGADT